MARCLISLGSNLGARGELLNKAIQSIDRTDGIRVEKVSQFVETKAVGGPPGQPNFLNGAAVLATSLDPVELLIRLQQVERVLGRVRDVRWGKRTLDLDILLIGDVVCHVPKNSAASQELIIPHPRMIVRRFVLEPATQIAADWVHPVSNWTVRQHFVHLVNIPPRFAFDGLHLSGRQDAAIKIAQRCGADVVLAQWPQRSVQTDGTARLFDWAQLTFDQQLQYALNKYELLSSPRWSASVDKPTIADFCSVESMILCEMTMSTDQVDLLRNLQKEWQPVAEPKLHIIVEQIDGGNDFLNAFQRSLKTRLIQVGDCLVYNVDASDEAWMIDECVAAIESMQ